MEYLTIKEVSELKCCKPQYIQKLAKDGKLDAVLREHPQNHKPCYMIPVSSLPEDLKSKYYGKLKKEAGIITESIQKSVQAKKVKCKRILSFEDCTEQQRKTINTWTGILNEWQGLRAGYHSKTEFDKLYIGKCQLEHPELQISTDILYRKWAAYKKNDLAGILGLRGAWNKESTTIPKPVWDYFLYLWMSENRPTVPFCYKNTISWTEEFYPELTSEMPTERTFRRHIESELTEAVRIYARYGEKAFSDRFLPYVMRQYDEMQPNDVWIADNHTLDIQSLDENGSIHRLYLTAFMDAKSGVITGWNITDSPTSQSTIIALRHGIIRFGIPKSVYFDNGREFLTHDVGGKGHRRRKSDEDVLEPPTILQRLGIEMRNAIVRNAKAKPIERTFCTVKNQFSRAFDGFCGGTILERPESLKRRIKNKAIPMDYEVRSYMDTWIDGEYNLQEYGGSERKYKGMSRLDVWNSEIKEVRRASESELNLMLMRSSRIQKIKRNGVYITVAGEKLWYMKAEETITHIGDEVYVRYDPADLTSVRIYSADDRYLFTWNLADALMIDYITQQKEEIADAQALIRRTGKFIREQARGLTANLTAEQRITAIDMTVRRAAAAKGKDFHIEMPKNIVPVRMDEEIPEQMHTDMPIERVTIDLKRMKKNSEIRKEQEYGIYDSSTGTA